MVTGDRSDRVAARAPDGVPRHDVVDALIAALRESDDDRVFLQHIERAGDGTIGAAFLRLEEEARTCNIEAQRVANPGRRPQAPTWPFHSYRGKYPRFMSTELGGWYQLLSPMKKRAVRLAFEAAALRRVRSFG